MEHRIFDHAAVAQMLDDDPLEQFGRDPGIPHPFRVYHDDRAAGADTETGRLTPLHPSRPEEQSFALQQRRQQPIERPPVVVGRAVPARAHEHVPRVRLHQFRQVTGRRHELFE